MTRSHLIRMAVAVAAAAVSSMTLSVAARQLQVTGRDLSRLPAVANPLNPQERLLITAVSSTTGRAEFASADGAGLLLPLASNAPAEARALSFVSLYGQEFGLADASQLQVKMTPEVDGLGIEHVRFQQVHLGVPVRGGEFLVHLRGARVSAANGHISANLPMSVTPAAPAATALEAARAMMSKANAGNVPLLQYSEPRLEILNRDLLTIGEGDTPRLTWFLEVTGPAIRELVWVDANVGTMVLHFSQIETAKSRKVYTAGGTSTLPGTLVRSEGGPPTGDSDQDLAYDYAGATYDYYFTNHGRNSYDNNGAPLLSTVHFSYSDCPNAFWDGVEMVYCNGAPAADDVVGHELTHAITDRTAGLLYFAQSGALNESFSDIFGETIDLTDGSGTDTSSVRWKLGEDFTGVGVFRDMMTPTLFGDPGKMSDSQFYCSDGDNRGVHINSGVPNHAYALMVDGGTYNGTTVTGIGLTKAGKIEYRALTTYLVAGSTFLDDFNALNLSCGDLVGTAGITSTDCAQVLAATTAVGMDQTWSCAFLTGVPPMCPSGSVTTTAQDTFESGLGNWTATNSSVGSWGRSTAFPATGSFSIHGDDGAASSDIRLTMTNAVTIPAGGRLYFDHVFDFEYFGTLTFDGGVIEYSTNGGSTWTDAGSMIDAGPAYTGTMTSSTGNVMGGRPGFVKTTFGYRTGTRLNLSSLAGQSVKLRFRIGTDVNESAEGWYIDNVTIYSCTASTATPTRLTVVDDAAHLLTVNLSTGVSTLVGTGNRVLTDVAVTPGGTLWGTDGSALYSINPNTGATTLVGGLNVNGMNGLVTDGPVLLGVSASSQSLYTINTASGAATPFTGSLGYFAAGDLALVNNILYGAVLNGGYSDLVKITRSGNSITTVRLGHVTNDQTLFSLASGNDGGLYGITGRAVLKIDPAAPQRAAIVMQNYTTGISNIGIANGAASFSTSPFTDPDLVAGTTGIKAVHITELRSHIDALRVRYGLTAYPWAQAITANATLIRASHIAELRSALAAAYTARGSAVPVYSVDSNLIAGIGIKAAHITELRGFVLDIE